MAKPKKIKLIYQEIFIKTQQKELIGLYKMCIFITNNWLIVVHFIFFNTEKGM